LLFIAELLFIVGLLLIVALIFIFGLRLLAVRISPVQTETAWLTALANNNTPNPWAQILIISKRERFTQYPAIHQYPLQFSDD
jgi:hypothetical protein